MVSHTTAFWEPQWLSEVAWSSWEGYKGCLRIMRQIGMNKSSMEWFEPVDSPFYASFLDEGVKVELTRPVMYRVCDVRASLEALHPAGQGSLLVRIADGQIEENTGVWRVKFAGGLVSAARVDDLPQISMDIGVFTQAFLGDPNLLELAHSGLIVVEDPACLAAASELMPYRPVYCGDFF